MQAIRIDVLPNEVLLAIFDFYVVAYEHTKLEIEKWQLLVHVCRRWRSLVFGSPCYLNLRLFCTPKTPVTDTLDVWPALPLVINGNTSLALSEDNILVALGHSNRIQEVILWEVAPFQLEKVLATMQVPYPELKCLRLSASRTSESPAVLDSFLGGLAPCLRHLSLDGIPFVGLSKFLLSTTHLVDLHLGIPQSGYILPEAMVTCLAVLTNLDTFSLKLQSFHSHPDRRTQHSPLLTRSVLSALGSFQFEGSSRYLEDLVAHIDAPRLYDFFTTFRYQRNFSIPQLFKFISRTPALKAPVEAHAIFGHNVARVELISRTFGRGRFHVQPPYGPSRSDWELAWQLSSMVKVFASSSESCPLFTVENLYVEDQGSGLRMTSRVETTQWWEFLRPFVAVKNIYLYKYIAFHIAYSLQKLGGGQNLEVLPALQTIFMHSPEAGPLAPSRIVYGQGPMGPFIAARQLLGHSITITASHW